MRERHSLRSFGVRNEVTFLCLHMTKWGNKSQGFISCSVTIKHRKQMAQSHWEKDVSGSHLKPIVGLLTPQGPVLLQAWWVWLPEKLEGDREVNNESSFCRTPLMGPPQPPASRVNTAYLSYLSTILDRPVSSYPQRTRLYNFSWATPCRLVVTPQIFTSINYIAALSLHPAGLWLCLSSAQQLHTG